MSFDFIFLLHRLYDIKQLQEMGQFLVLGGTISESKFASFFMNFRCMISFVLLCI